MGHVDAQILKERETETDRERDGLQGDCNQEYHCTNYLIIVIIFILFEAISIYRVLTCTCTHVVSVLTDVYKAGDVYTCCQVKINTVDCL